MAMSLYIWVKLGHLLCVMGWVATVFALAAVLPFVAERAESADVRERFVRFGLAAYRLGHHLFGWAVLFGLVLWLYFGVAGGWLHVKLALVLALLVQFSVGGRRLKRIRKGGSLISRRWALWYRRIPALLLLGIVWLALGKPI